MTALIVLKTARAYLPLLLGAVALVGGLPAFILAILLDALLLLVGGGRRARVDAVATALLSLAALATCYRRGSWRSCREASASSRDGCTSIRRVLVRLRPPRARGLLRLLRQSPRWQRRRPGGGGSARGIASFFD